MCILENIKLNFSKCIFAQSKINFVSYEIQNGTITHANASIEMKKKTSCWCNRIGKIPRSNNVYHKFIDKYAEIRPPLSRLIKKNILSEWNTNCQNSFQKLKYILIAKPILKLHDPKLLFHMFVDALKVAVGAVLNQPDDKKFSTSYCVLFQSFAKLWQNYFITEIEGLAIVDIFDKFYHYLPGLKFTIHPDQACLVWLKNAKNGHWNLACLIMRLDMKGCLEILYIILLDLLIYFWILVKL